MNQKSKKRIKITLVSLIILSIAFISFTLFETKDDINATFSNIDQKLQELQRTDRNAGFSVSVFTKDSVLFKKGYGFSDVKNEILYTDTTRQYIASISKTTIGVSLLKAQELGLLHIENDINDYLPFKISNPNFPNEKITLKQLATHTSSLDYNENVVESLYITENEKNKSLKGFIHDYFEKGVYGEITYMENKPGAIFNYSNIGAGLAAYIIEITSKMSYAEFSQKYIFNPLELKNTSWFLTSKDTIGIATYYELENKKLKEVKADGVILYPARDLITNINDLTTYCQAIMSTSSKLLTEESYAILLNPQLDHTTENDVIDNSGLFWMIDRNQYGVTYQLTGMNGGDNMISTKMWFDPKTELGYIFVGNTGVTEQNRINHIWLFKTLVSLGDHYMMTNPKNSFLDKISYKWHNLYNRVRAIF